MTLNRLRPAPLEDWLRENYFTAEIDISSSGVYSYSMAALRTMAGVGLAALDELVFDDGYSLGAPAVREAVARHSGGADPAKVMTTSGSGEAISLVLSALLRPGDEVVVVQPGYHLLTEYAVALGATVRTWRLDPANGWRPRIEDLEALLTPRTRAVIVNFPQNPTGATLTVEQTHRLLDLAESVGAYVLWDGALTMLAHDAEPLPEVTRLYERAVSFGTFSKAFGLPGLRFGWCIAPQELLTECVRIRDYTTLHVAPLIELLALAVLNAADEFIEPRLKQARANRDTLRDWADAHPGLIELAQPAGGVCAFPRLLPLENTDAFCEELFQTRSTLVIPGSCFGEPGHIRIGYGGDPDLLEEGLGRLTEVLAGAAR